MTGFGSSTTGDCCESTFTGFSCPWAGTTHQRFTHIDAKASKIESGRPEFFQSRQEWIVRRVGVRGLAKRLDHGSQCLRGRSPLPRIGGQRSLGPCVGAMLGELRAEPAVDRGQQVQVAGLERQFGAIGQCSVTHRDFSGASLQVG